MLKRHKHKIGGTSYASPFPRITPTPGVKRKAQSKMESMENLEGAEFSPPLGLAIASCYIAFQAVPDTSPFRLKIVSLS